MTRGRRVGVIRGRESLSEICFLCAHAARRVPPIHKQPIQQKGSAVRSYLLQQLRGTFAFAAPHGVRIAFGKQTTCRSFNHEFECRYKISLEVQIILSKPGFDKLFVHRRELVSGPIRSGGPLLILDPSRLVAADLGMCTCTCTCTCACPCTCTTCTCACACCTCCCACA